MLSLIQWNTTALQWSVLVRITGLLSLSFKLDTTSTISTSSNFGHRSVHNTTKNRTCQFQWFNDSFNDRRHHHHHHFRLLEVVIRNQWQKHVSREKWKNVHWYGERKTVYKYKLLCPRGTQTCALQTDTRRWPQPTYRQTDTHRWPQPTSRLTEMEKWSWIRIQNPISTKIELVLEVHRLLPPTKFGGDPWTRSWDILRTKTVRTDRHTPMITRPCGLRRAGKNLITVT